MIFFKVYGNVNIKIADNSLISFKNFDDTLTISENEIYISSYDDSLNVKKVLKKAGDKYTLKYLSFETVKNYCNLPPQVGIESDIEINKINNNYSTNGVLFSDRQNEDVVNYFPNQLGQSLSTIAKKIANKKKSKIKIAILDLFNEKIGEILCGLRAIELLYENLRTQYEEVLIDVFIQSVDRVHFLRDVEIIRLSPFVSFVKPLPIAVKTLESYDFLIDNSSLDKELLFAKIPKIDLFLLKFGLNFQDIPYHKKQLKLDFKKFNIGYELLQTLDIARKKGKLLLFHPYSPDFKRSIPKDVTLRLFKQFVLEAHTNDFVMVSTLKIDNFEDDCFVDLSRYSKTFLDFAYLISQMDAIITVETATIYLADLFFVPTLVIFADEVNTKNIKYHGFQRSYILEKSIEKNFSHFSTADERLTINKHKNWKSLEAKKLLDELAVLI